MSQTYNIKIQNEKFGTILDEVFVNASQFKLFLKILQSCIELKDDLTFFNGTDFFIHVPKQHLVDSLIVTKVETMTMADHLIKRSKLEAQEIK